MQPQAATHSSARQQGNKASEQFLPFTMSVSNVRDCANVKLFLCQFFADSDQPRHQVLRARAVVVSTSLSRKPTIWPNMSVRGGRCCSSPSSTYHFLTAPALTSLYRPLATCVRAQNPHLPSRETTAMDPEKVFILQSRLLARSLHWLQQEDPNAHHFIEPKSSYEPRGRLEYP